MKRILLFANTGWYLYNHRLSLAKAARDAGYEVLLASPEDAFVQRLQAEGFEWHALEVDRRGLNPVREAAAIVRMWRLYRRLRPDLVHHFTIKPVIYGTIAARLSSVPGIVNSVTGLGYVFIQDGARSTPLKRLAQGLYRRALAADNVRVIFQNPEDQQMFLGNNMVRAEAVALIRGSGVDVDRYKPEPERGGVPRAVYVGRMLWDKGIAELAEAARILKREAVQGDVVLVGTPDEGNPASIPEEQLRAWEAQGLLAWWGQREDMPAVYAGSQVVVLPSYSEGLPRTLIEAAACGRAMVATDIAGCREVVEDGRNGLLVRVRDPDALARAIKQLFENADLRRVMGVRAREKAEAEFSDRLVAERTLEIYRGLIEERHG